jgi:hypothetical protein
MQTCIKIRTAKLCLFLSAFIRVHQRSNYFFSEVADFRNGKFGFARNYAVTRHRNRNGEIMSTPIKENWLCSSLSSNRTINPISPTTWLQGAIASQHSACTIVVEGEMISERITPEGRAAVRHNLLKHGLTALRNRSAHCRRRSSIGFDRSKRRPIVPSFGAGPIGCSPGVVN